MKLPIFISAAALLTMGLSPVFAAPSHTAIRQQPKPTQLYRGAKAVALNTTTDQRLALISTDGSISRSIGGVVSSQSFSTLGFTGEYEVVFNRDVTQCMYLGNVGAPGIGDPGSGEVAFTSRSGNPNAIFVVRRDSTGNFANGSFFVSVFCPKVTR